ncbi:MAG: ABC transporter substrate-binding protein [Spirochaeta sp. LUC14_002_19_P3]|nr:MAG: ABC transporter substrate-binding protein [Spirochaeta sp. LUC14_002_19_P3]
MRKALTMLIIAVCTAVLVFSGCKGKEGPALKMMHNKVEIDTMLKAYAADWGTENGVGVTIISTGGSSDVSLGQQLTADYAAGEMPDIFVIDGPEAYKEWQSIILDLSNEPWVANTSVAFTVDGKVYGFPVAVEGWGMAYNADVLAAADVDPAGLNNYAAYMEAFEKIDAMKDELGLDSVVSMAASIGMGWVTAHHNFNSLLSNGLPYGDKSVAEALLAGNIDEQRLSEYADWVELLFMYADPAVLTTGDYDAQVGAFANGKAAFLHQGNWTDPNMAQANVAFKMAFAPHGSMQAVTDGIFVAAPSFYVINSESKNVEAAKKFLADMVATERGNKYMVEEAGMIPAFSNVQLSPAGQLSTSVQSWSSMGKVYSWNQYLFTGEFRDNVLAPIYNQFAQKQIDKAQFIELMTQAFMNL